MPDRIVNAGPDSDALATLRTGFFVVGEIVGRDSYDNTDHKSKYTGAPYPPLKAESPCREGGEDTEYRCCNISAAVKRKGRISVLPIRAVATPIIEASRPMAA